MCFRTVRTKYVAAVVLSLTAADDHNLCLFLLRTSLVIIERYWHRHLCVVYLAMDIKYIKICSYLCVVKERWQLLSNSYRRRAVHEALAAAACSIGAVASLFNWC